jgi:alanine-glyoxylate transaminase/serine-glyoxylate transaminase/serine-pyruvate transaminase
MTHTREIPRDTTDLDIPNRLLLGPGPSNADPRVLQKMSVPLLGHLDPVFLTLMNRIQELLRYTFETTNPLTLAVPGTGTAAMEAAVANLVEPGDRVLVCVNGYFGMRISEMARRYGADVRVISKPWGQVFSLDDIRQALAARQEKLVALVHAETSTGALQPLEGIADLVHAQDGLLLVDAVTSLGGLPVSVDRLEVDACYSGAQKNLSCPPGLSPLTFSPAAEARLQNRHSPVTSFYLDLTLLGKYWGAERQYHHTAPISTAYGLFAALRLVAEEGLEQRWERHRFFARRLWEGLQGLGLEFHVPEAHRLPTLTTVCIPQGVDDLLTRQKLLQEYGIEIGGGLGELKGKVWRIGLMGYNARQESVDRLLDALRFLLGK